MRGISGSKDAHLGEKIRKLRKQQHMTQEKLAEKAEIDTSYLGQIERGVRQSPSVFIVAKIAGALGIGEGELLEKRKGDPSDFDEGDIPEKIAEELKKLTPREQQMYDKIFRMLLELSELGRSK
ncbi:helix-turn-helix domain-containing protein [Saccharibacillus sacchari]|uniref:helix-turn-helix domain-containing protein n=1 Tax=Saccharibacillus sacchari TaxID=456493 RepID=UPI00248114D2|nr:helix-turn-helix transcriptional regulator [Saccharibacillus sacchari]